MEGERDTRGERERDGVKDQGIEGRREREGERRCRRRGREGGREGRGEGRGGGGGGVGGGGGEGRERKNKIISEHGERKKKEKK